MLVHTFLPPHAIHGDTISTHSFFFLPCHSCRTQMELNPAVKRVGGVTLASAAISPILVDEGKQVGLPAVFTTAMGAWIHVIHSLRMFFFSSLHIVVLYQLGLLVLICP